MSVSRADVMWLIVFVLGVQSCAPRASMAPSMHQMSGSRALLCEPMGRGPFPAVVYNHGLVVDQLGFEGAQRHGYNLTGICEALAADGYLALAPIRSSGRGNIPGHAQEVARAVDEVKADPRVDRERVALMGFSRGGLLTLLVGLERRDLKALLILAPAPGRGRFAAAVKRITELDAPVLLLVEAGDDPEILEGADLLERALKAHGNEHRSIRYRAGGGHRLFWGVGYYWPDIALFLREKLGGTARPGE